MIAGSLLAGSATTINAQTPSFTFSDFAGAVRQGYAAAVNDINAGRMQVCLEDQAYVILYTDGNPNTPNKFGCVNIDTLSEEEQTWNAAVECLYKGYTITTRGCSSTN